MVLIQSITTYRDGGSILIKCYMSSTVSEKFDLPRGEYDIVIDYRAGGETNGRWTFGYPDKPQFIVINDENFKNDVISQIEQKIQREQFLINKIRNNNGALRPLV